MAHPETRTPGATDPGRRELTSSYPENSAGTPVGQAAGPAATGLQRYDEACRALAAAKSFDEARDIRNRADAWRVYAKQAKNRTLEIDAAEIQFRAERRIGEMMAAQRENGGLAKGVRGQFTGGSSADLPVEEPTLSDAGIDKHLADRARKYAAIPDGDFEAQLAGWREGCLDERVRPMVNLLAHGNPWVKYNSGHDGWRTPPEILEAARLVLGNFDLDPASSENANRLVRASVFFTVADDGLAKTWPVGSIWLNPPYTVGLVDRFAARLIAEVRRGSTAIALTNNATETRWAQTLLAECAALCLPCGRVRYLDESGSAGSSGLQGQCIFYFGPGAQAFRAAFAGFGAVLPGPGAWK